MSITVYQSAYQIPNIIEVIGMPAVGKSTYCQKIVAKNSSYVDSNALLPENHFIRQIYKLGSILSMCFRHPIAFFKSIWLIRKTKQKSIIDFLKVSSNWCLMWKMSDRACSKQGKVFVFDQGIYQGLWSILFSCKTESSSIMQLLEYVKKPAIVVLLDDEDKVLKERENKREKSIRLDYSNEEDIQKGRKALSTVKEYIMNHYEKKENSVV